MIARTQEHSSSLPPRMQVKSQAFKKEPIYKHDPEMSLPSLGPSSFKMDRGEVEDGPEI